MMATIFVSKFFHLEFCHLEFSHHAFSHFVQKKTSLIHSDSNWWWQPSWILPYWIQTLPSSIQTLCYLHSDLLTNTFPPLWPWLKLIFWVNLTNLMMTTILNSAILDSAICTKKLHSFILTQLDDGSHLEFCHIGFRHCHLAFKHFVIFTQIYSQTLFLHSDPDSN